MALLVVELVSWSRLGVDLMPALDFPIVGHGHMALGWCPYGKRSGAHVRGVGESPRAKGICDGLFAAMSTA
jgi:hypothetical protein